MNYAVHLKNVHIKYCSRDCLVFKHASNCMEIAWPLQESMDISVHTLMQIVHTFWADLNVKLKNVLVKTPSVQTFQYIG